MGTLFSQPPRDYKSVTEYKLLGIAEACEMLVKRKGVSFDQALQIYEIAEIARRNDLFATNGDIWDEQIAGIGQILERGIADDNL